MTPPGRKINNISLTICTWPNWPAGAKILSGFQIEGKTDVWISQVRRVKDMSLKNLWNGSINSNNFKNYFRSDLKLLFFFYDAIS